MARQEESVELDLSQVEEGLQRPGNSLVGGEDEKIFQPPVLGFLGYWRIAFLAFVGGDVSRRSQHCF